MCVPAQWLQLCPTLCNPMDYGPPGSLSMEFSWQEYWHGLPFPSTWAANLVAKPRGWVGFRYGLIKGPPPTTMKGPLLVLVSPSVSSTVRKAAPSFLEDGCSCSLSYILPSFNASAQTFPVTVSCLLCPIPNQSSGLA